MISKIYASNLDTLIKHSHKSYFCFRAMFIFDIQNRGVIYRKCCQLRGQYEKILTLNHFVCISSVTIFFSEFSNVEGILMLVSNVSCQTVSFDSCQLQGTFLKNVFLRTNMLIHDFVLDLSTQHLQHRLKIRILEAMTNCGLINLLLQQEEVNMYRRHKLIFHVLGMIIKSFFNNPKKKRQVDIIQKERRISALVTPIKTYQITTAIISHVNCPARFINMHKIITRVCFTETTRISIVLINAIFLTHNPSSF